MYGREEDWETFFTDHCPTPADSTGIEWSPHKSGLGLCTQYVCINACKNNRKLNVKKVALETNNNNTHNKK